MPSSLLRIEPYSSLQNFKVHTSDIRNEASTQVEGCNYAQKSNSERIADCGVTSYSLVIVWASMIVPSLDDWDRIHR